MRLAKDWLARPDGTDEAPNNRIFVITGLYLIPDIFINLVFPLIGFSGISG
jgi:hypothetical protein